MNIQSFLERVGHVNEKAFPRFSGRWFVGKRALASPENMIAAKDTQNFREVLQFVYTQKFVIV